MPLLPLIAAKSQKRQRHSAGKAGEPPPQFDQRTLKGPKGLKGPKKGPNWGTNWGTNL